VWNLGGLTIQTTLDPQAQAAAHDAATNGADAADPVAATVVQVEPGTGHIVSMAQSRPYGNDANAHQTTINLNVSEAMGGSTYGFQTGSTFKPITAAAALEETISPARTYTTGHKITLQMSAFTDCEGNRFGSADERVWKVRNERRDETGTWDMTDALGQSINTYFASLERDTGLCETARMAADMGVERGDNQPLQVVPSLTLGAQTVAPLQMATAYATFANRGTYCEPVAITAVTDADGEEMDVPASECEQVMSEHTADSINVMLRGVVEDGTGTTAGLTDRDNAGKTGTTDKRRDVWFVGYTPELATAVRVGGDADLPPMVDMTIGGTYFDEASGAALAGPIYREAMLGALEGVPASSFNEVDVPRWEPEPPPSDEGGDGGEDDEGPPSPPDFGDIGGGGDWEDLPELPEWPTEWPNGGNGNGGGGGWRD
jgi:membrane peptidoglycan carboxypeptidase